MATRFYSHTTDSTPISILSGGLKIIIYVGLNSSCSNSVALKKLRIVYISIIDRKYINIKSSTDI